MPSSTISTSGSTSQDSRSRATTSSAPTTATLPATNPSPNPRCGRIARANRRVRSPPVIQYRARGHQAGGVVAHHHIDGEHQPDQPTQPGHPPVRASAGGPVPAWPCAGRSGEPACADINTTSTSNKRSPTSYRAHDRRHHCVDAHRAARWWEESHETPARSTRPATIWWPSSAVLVGNRLGHRTRVHRGGASCTASVAAACSSACQSARHHQIEYRVPAPPVVAVAWVAEDSAPRHLIIRLIIHTIRRDPSGPSGSTRHPT